MVRPGANTSFEWLEPLDLDVPRRLRSGRIDEDGDVRSAQVICQLRHQLVPLEDHGSGESRIVTKALRGVPAEPVVGAKCVPYPMTSAPPV